MNLRNILSAEELAAVVQRSNFLGARILLFDWAVIGCTFFLAASYPNPLTWLLAILILGPRQLGLGVVVHETGHRTLFTSAAANDFCGKWLSGYFVFSDKDSYMKVHLRHHGSAGTTADPDLGNYRDYPIDRRRFQRKLIRDITGQVGWKRVKSIARSMARLRDLEAPVRQYLLRSLGANALLVLVLAACGHGELYLLWIIAFMTSHMLVSRIRQISEHAAVPDSLDPDPRQNTRTLEISWLERFFIAPHQVNYHLEHHLMASVPIYRLRQLHQLLLKKGYYDGMRFMKGYTDLLASVTNADRESGVSPV